MWKSKYCSRDVAVKVIRTYSNTNLQKVVGVSRLLTFFPRLISNNVTTQKFCKEVVTWQTLQHPNVLPLIGVTMTETQFAMVSDWMANGNINEFTEKNPAADRRELVGVSLKCYFILPVL